MHNAWTDICNVIYNINKYSVFKSIKIPLYGLVANKFDTRIKHIGKMFIKYFKYNKKIAFKSNAYDYIFFLPYFTPSNKDNILPVVKYCKSKLYNILLIIGDDCNVNEIYNYIPNCEIVKIGDLHGYTSINERIRLFYFTMIYYFKLYSIFQGYEYIQNCIMKNPIRLYHYIYSSLFYACLFKHIFTNISSNYALSTSDFWPIENQFICSAKENHIRTYVIQHGISTEYWWPFDSDYYLLWGDLHIEKLIELGAPRNRLINAGMPALDGKVGGKKNIQIKRGFPINVLVISQTNVLDFNEDDLNTFANCIRELCNYKDKYIITVKLHPNEDMSFYKKHGFDRVNDIIFIKNEKKIHDLISESDLCITVFSTGGLEAIAFYKPLFVLNIVEWVDRYAWWPKYGGGIYISNVSLLNNILNNILEDRYLLENIINTQNLFIEKAFSNYGNSSQAIINQLEAGEI